MCFEDYTCKQIDALKSVTAYQQTLSVRGFPIFHSLTMTLIMTLTMTTHGFDHYFQHYHFDDRAVEVGCPGGREGRIIVGTAVGLTVESTVGTTVAFSNLSCPGRKAIFLFPEISNSAG